MTIIGIISTVIFGVGTGIGAGLLAVALALTKNVQMGDSKGEFKDFSRRKIKMLKENYDPGIF